MDIRGKRTRQAIAESFLEALKERPASKITVTDICARACINRATFYKHYLDIPDLQEQMEEEVLADFKTFLCSSDFLGEAKYRTMLIGMLNYMEQYGSRFYLLCSGNAGSDLPARVFRLLNEYGFSVMRNKIPGVREEKAELLYHFLTRGCGAVLTHWVREESRTDVEEMADFIMQISGATVAAVTQEG